MKCGPSLPINRTSNGARLALDSETTYIIGVHVGERSLQGASCLWQSIQALYRQCAVCYTDFWSAYNQVFPESRHKAVSKTSGKTNGIGR